MLTRLEVITMKRIVGFLLSLVVLGLTTQGMVHADDDPLLIFAAASLGGPLDSIASRYMAETGTPVLIAYGASGTLAQQIRIGADVDLFISADTSWVTRLATDPNSAVSHWVPFLRNQLVLVTSSDLDHRTRAFGPLDGPTIGKIAIADPEAAPAGRYAATYLQRIGVYDKIHEKLVIVEDVRGVIQAVHLGVADVGFVYSSDVAVTGRVRSVEVIPDSLYPPIVYGLATMRGSRVEKVKMFVQFLTGSEASATFVRAGFTVDTTTVTR